MIKRTAEELLIKLSNQFSVIVITGPRQSGKTTLAKKVFPQKKYISFDDIQLRELAKSNPKDFLEAFPDGLIIDEVQKVPEIFDTIKLFIDNSDFEPGKYILTGSSQIKLRENTSESLAGRAAYLKLLPFSINELKDAEKLPNLPYDLIFKGEYPPLYDEKKKIDYALWYENYISTYIDMDVRNQIKAENLIVFKKFIQICALYSGKIFSADGVARSLGVSSPTIKSWLSILEASYILHFLEPDFENLGKKLIKSPKLYFMDTGLLCHLLRISNKEELLLSKEKGAIVETFAVSELLKARYNIGKTSDLSFFRDMKGFEVDIIADWKHSFAIEVKSDYNPEEKLSSNIKKYLNLKKSPNASGMVFYLGDWTMKINGINYVSWKDWDNIVEM